MNLGLLTRFTDHRDFDLLKSFGATTFDTDDLPHFYSADAGLTMPNQLADGFPFGCTGYSQTDICTDEDGVIYDAGELYLSTPPNNPNTGRAVRDSLKLLCSRGPKDKQGNLGKPRTSYYNIRSYGLLDWYNAIRVGLWITQSEKRSASVAIPWFSEFGNTGSDGILPEVVNYSWSNASGHNAKIAGWTDTNTKGKLIRGGETFLMVKPWLGVEFGDRGWCYMSRTSANAIFNMWFTEVFTVTKMDGIKQTIDLPVIEKLVSFILNLLRKL